MKPTGLRLHLPATYQIQVQGLLSPKWSDRMGGMTIWSEQPIEGALPVTTLSGLLTDQAALIGVISSLYDLRLPIISVECLESEM